MYVYRPTYAAYYLNALLNQLNAVTNGKELLDIAWGCCVLDKLHFILILFSSVQSQRECVGKCL